MRLRAERSLPKGCTLKLRLVSIVWLLLSLTPAVWAEIQPSPVPGGIARIPLPNDVDAARFNGSRVLVTIEKGQSIAWVGLPLSTPPSIQQIDTTAGPLRFEVQDKRYETEHLTITNDRKVNPLPMDYDRIQSERREMDQVFLSFTDALPSLTWQAPLAGRYSSSFGKRRVLNGNPRSPHSGLDIAAPEGTPIQSVSNGLVAAVGDYFFNGQTVMVDHGQGLISMYCHLSAISVELGESITAGTVIGAVGQTGRVTGPHLHLSVSLNNARVDPLLFFSASQDP